jgi:hypothetical protein
MTRHDTIEKLTILLNNGYAFNEQKVLTLKKILLDSDLKEMNIKDLMNLDKTKYTTAKAKRIIYTNALKRIGFKIDKRKKPFLRKRIIRNCLNYLPEYVFKTFWIIKIQDE